MLKFKSHLISIISLIFLLVGILIFLIAVTYNNFVSMDANEVPNISLNPVWLFIAFSLILFLVIRYSDMLEKINSNYLFVLLLLLFLLIGLYLVFFSDDYLRKADPGISVNIAQQFNQGNYSVLNKKGSYIDTYPFQIYWISWLRFLLGINNSIRFLYFVNLVLSSLAMVFMFLLSKLILNKKQINISLILAFLFTPQVFNVLFVYGNVVALTLFLGGVLFLLVSLNEKHSDNWIYLSILLVTYSYLLKNNYLIGIVALFITLFLLKMSNKKKFMAIIFSLFVILISNFSMTSYYANKSDNKQFSLDGGIPKSAYVVMGLNEHGSKSGWFDASTINLYKEYKFSSKRTDDAAKKLLRSRVNHLLSHPKALVAFLNEKWITTWSDPTFQSLWNAPLPTWQGKFHTNLFKKIYSINGQSKISKIIRRISQFTVWVILIGSVYVAYMIIDGSLALNDKVVYSVLSFLFFIGGFIFHTFWETKAQYVYQYIFLLIPTAAMGIGIISNKVKTKYNVKKEERTKHTLNDNL